MELFFSSYVSPFIKLKIQINKCILIKISTFFPPYIKRHNSINIKLSVIESCPPVFWSDPLSFYPALTGSKTPTSKFGDCEEVRWEITAR
ncbi:hypothetical protein COK05_18255 [Bacillus cereus]|uniref:Uncharacterized protein n=1 Tax=Bacillus cereus TaxID=1396 RepID=A0A2B2LH68_BACCE|nr:hypothetical protein COK05_18255 [Bacillus cereus]